MTSLIFALLLSISALLGPENMENTTNSETQYTEMTPGPGDGGSGGLEEPPPPPG